MPQPDEGLPAHKVREVYFSGTSAANIHVDLTATIDLKLQALLSHRSQLTAPEEIARYVRQMASQCGAQSGGGCAEGFRRLEVPQ